jgi:hypothetical protein
MRVAIASALIIAVSVCRAQELPQTADATAPAYKNVIRYNISGAVLFGIDKYVVFGYERVIKSNQSFSVNFGTAAMPSFVTITTADFELQRDLRNSGFNFSGDYRFYLKKENRYPPPHGLYIGPYYSFNHFERDNHWKYRSTGTGSDIDTQSNFNIHTVGFEIGYQFVLWRRMIIDMVMMGPGIGMYNYEVTFNTPVSTTEREQLLQGMAQLLTQKFPGMNFVFADQQFEADGTLRTSAAGFRYIVHVGFRF